MTKANKTPRSNAWRKPFLLGLAQTSNVAASARKAGIDVSTVYKTRHSDAGFAHAWFAALCEGYDNLELELLRRLREGELDSGTKGAVRRKFDNGNAFRLLAAHRATVQRQRGRNDYEYEDQLLASINAKLEKMRQRTLARSATSQFTNASQTEDADGNTGT